MKIMKKNQGDGSYILDKKMLRKPNTDGWGNKLVTIFAWWRKRQPSKNCKYFMGPNALFFFWSFYHHDNFLPSIKFPSRRMGGSAGLLYLDMTVFTLLPGLAKIAPWWLAHRDSFSANVPGLVTADGATNVYSLNRRAVRCHSVCGQDRFSLSEFFMTIIFRLF